MQAPSMAKMTLDPFRKTFINWFFLNWYCCHSPNPQVNDIIYDQPLNEWPGKGCTDPEALTRIGMSENTHVIYNDYDWPAAHLPAQ